MSARARWVRLLDLATLRRSRELLRVPGGRLLAISIGLVYLFVSLLIGQMLFLGPTQQVGTTIFVLPGGTIWWNYPALLVESPNAILVLPFFATLSMLLVSAGVALGMGVAVVLSAKLLRQRRRELGRPTAVGGVAGLTPVMISLVTLGACCSTTAAATAGIGLAAQASGTTLGALLYNTWYLGVFQMVVLWVALVAQEQLVVVYGVLLGLPGSETSPPTLGPAGARCWASGALRVGLLAAGVTWALALLAEWTGPTPPPATVATVLGASAQHLFLPLVAVGAALAPAGLLAWSGPSGRRLLVRSARVALFLTSTSLLTWLPPGVASAGAHGLLNELFFQLGAPAAWAPVSAGVPVGLGLALRWVFQFLLLGAFGLALALFPGSVASALGLARPAASAPIAPDAPSGAVPRSARPATAEEP
jgi:hypothetical protein